ncbi:MAG: hypothetical protein IIA72_19920 [Proteobacteria bacterium]|nr:hypothetical protein [Pseudomonadota bacterium]
MRQIENLADTRLLAQCVYCGSGTETKDHVPSKVLLDKPYPENLPVVFACQSCNASFAADEEYVACLLECVLSGSADPTDISRERVRSILEKRPALAARLANARQAGQDGIVFAIEEDRVRNIMLKLARGHAAYELSEPQDNEPDVFSVLPLPLLTDEQRTAFETPPVIEGWPEVGSRAMHRVIAGDAGWIVAQDGRYRYLAVAGGSVTVRIVLSEYLACEAVWH